MIKIEDLRAAADAEATKGPTVVVTRRLLAALADRLAVGEAAIAELAILEQRKQAA